MKDKQKKLRNLTTKLRKLAKYVAKRQTKAEKIDNKTEKTGCG